MNLEELKELCRLCGTSGREHAVREYILQKIAAAGIPKRNVTVDGIGNVIVKKKGRQRAECSVLFTAHMDEVALMVTHTGSDGMLSFEPVGGVLAAAVAGRQVRVGKDRIRGVIGCKPVHLLGKDEAARPLTMDNLHCDVGGECGVQPGDIIYFDTEPQVIGADSFAAKAIDDRFGCEVLLTLLRAELQYDVTVAFLVQEEVGLRGTKVLAGRMTPDFAVVLEATTAADLPDCSGAERVCALGKGAVISFIDGHTVYDKALYDRAAALCNENGIPWQTKSKIAGGNDAGALQFSGARVLAVSVPCRYLHAPVSLIRLSDAEACGQLALLLANTLPEGH